MTREPKATIAKEAPGVLTLWCIQWPSTLTGGGKVYFATTYPDSDLVYIETAAKRRAVGGTVKMRLEPVVRAAIKRARGAA